MGVPFIHCFRTHKEHYFYDFNTNAIVRVEKGVYGCLEEWEKNKKCPNMDFSIRGKIEELKEIGFLSDSHWKKIEHPATKMLEHYLNSSLETITLQVTQQCNLKCNYCPYSGSYYNREHNDRHMSFDIAKRAVDFYIRHSFDLPAIQIGFYGGEPLLEFSLIKEIVAYCKKACAGKEVRYLMTTNATLLTEDKIEFLMENDFILTISLDGPRQYHDRNRHKIDDSGTFDTVMNNISKIYEMYPHKRGNVQFNCVLDPTSDITCVNDFFLNEEMLKEYQVRFSSVSREGIKDEDKFLPDEQYLEQYKYELFKMFYAKTGKVRGIDVSKVVEEYYGQIKNIYAKRTLSCLKEEFSHPSGPCIPGVHKLFVDVKGDFYPCEKVCECSCDMVIGNVEHGLDLKEVDRHLNIGRLTEEQCKDCWSAKNCYICSAHLDQGQGLSSELKQRKCANVRSHIEDDFKNYCLLYELGSFKEDAIYFTGEGKESS